MVCHPGERPRNILLIRISTMKTQDREEFAQDIGSRTMPPRLTKVEVHRDGLPSGGTTQEHSVDTDKHYGNTGQGRVLKYLKRKLLSPH